MLLEPTATRSSVCGVKPSRELVVAATTLDNPSACVDKHQTSVRVCNKPLEMAEHRRGRSGEALATTRTSVVRQISAAIAP
jgi:hypothetical protein